ncbi:MAG: hypothetical protein GOV01_00290 [Candidatus Altiarchaeota archaeon]|nr:hypothetical protein [Candidatus Altiarchaeota archaeon]
MIDEMAWKNLRENLSARRSIGMVDRFFNEEDSKRLKVAYLTLRFIDDGVDIPWTGAVDEKDPRQEFLNQINESLPIIEDQINGAYRTHPDTQDLIRKANEVLESEDPIDELVEESNTDLTLATFLTAYGSYNQTFFGMYYMTEFIEGMQADLDKEGGLFNQQELFKYYEQIQAIPIMIGYRAMGIDFENDLPKGMKYQELYDAMNYVSQGIMLVKGCRGKELVEDAEMDRVYIASEELESVTVTKQDGTTSVGLSVEDFKATVFRDYSYFDASGITEMKESEKYQDSIAKLQSIVRDRVHRAHAYFVMSSDAISRLPNDGTLGDSKRFLGAYGYQAKNWSRELANNEYNPLNPELETGYVDLEMSTKDKIALGLKTKLLGNVPLVTEKVNSRILKNIFDWGFLDEQKSNEAFSLLRASAQYS